MNTAIGRWTAVRSVAPAIVLAAAVAACYSPTAYDTRSTQVALDVSADSADADGASRVVIKIYTPPRAQSGLNATLSVSAGTLLGASSGSLVLPLASADTARASWQAPQTTGSGILTVKVGSSILLHHSVRFVTAWPDTVEVEPDSAAVAATERAVVTIRVHLGRIHSPGTPTLGTRVTLDARDKDSVATIGRFLYSSPSDASGLVTARFAPGRTTYRDTLKIWATVGTGATARTGKSFVVVTDSS